MKEIANKSISPYNHCHEKHWQAKWQEGVSFTYNPDGQSKYYVLEMLPYPSGVLHMGHIRNYTIGDVLTRWKRAVGFNVLYTFGWDAFGLPAENAAKQNNISPKKWIDYCINSMKAQIKALGTSHDWARETSTCVPEYYKHQQEMFIRFYHAGLAFKKDSEVNWDPIDKTVLANEQVVDGRGWRSGALVETKIMSQWFFRISDYSKELLDGLKNLSEWPEKVKIMQKNWIGKSDGVKIKFKFSFNYAKQIAAEGHEYLEVFTTRPETLFGATFLAISLNHPLATIGIKNSLFKAELMQIKQLELIINQTNKFFSHILDAQNMALLGKIISFSEDRKMQLSKAIIVEKLLQANHNNLSNEKHLEHKQDSIPTSPNYTKKNAAPNLINLEVLEIELSEIAFLISTLKQQIIKQNNQNNATNDLFAILNKIEINIAPSNKSTNYIIADDLIIMAEKLITYIENFLPQKLNIDFFADLKNTIPLFMQSKTGGESGRQDLEKVGIFTELSCDSPMSGSFALEQLPIWITNYVLDGRGTGAIFGCPAHDKRDGDFANKYNIPKIEINLQSNANPNQEDKMINSSGTISSDYFSLFDKTSNDKSFVDNSIPLRANITLNDLNFAEARKKIISALEAAKIAEQHSEYRLRDWGISRQRYWGCPIPMIYCSNCGILPEKIANLPVMLPDPIAGVENPMTSESFTKCNCPKCGKIAKREQDTMDTFVDSSWYFLRYASNQESECAFNPEQINCTMPVDHYIGGIEHAILHLLYSRFFMIALKKSDYGINFIEPFKKLTTQALVLHRAYSWNSSSNASCVIRPSEKKSQNKNEISLNIIASDLIELSVKIAEETKGNILISIAEGGDCGVKFLHEIANQDKSSFIHSLESGCTFSFVMRGQKWIEPDLVVESDDGLIYVPARKWKCFASDAEISAALPISDMGVMKMSKSKLNVVNPDSIVEKYGADALRIAILSDAPIDQDIEWKEEKAVAAKRLLNKIWRIVCKVAIMIRENSNPTPSDSELLADLNVAINSITKDLENCSFNTIIAQIHILISKIEEKLQPENITSVCHVVVDLLALISPITPHLVESCWHYLKYCTEYSNFKTTEDLHPNSNLKIHLQETLGLDILRSDLFCSNKYWPQLKKIEQHNKKQTISIQVNGKLRGTIEVEDNSTEEDCRHLALAHSNVAIAIANAGGQIKKIIVVKNKTVSIVVG